MYVWMCSVLVGTSVANWYIYIYQIWKFWYILKELGTEIFDLVYMQNLVYIWYIFVGGFSWDFKPIYLVYYNPETDKSIVVLKLSKKVWWFCLKWQGCQIGFFDAKFHAFGFF